MEVAAVEVTRGQVFWWLGILFACLVVGGGGIYALRRCVKRADSPQSLPGLTLRQIREMRERGEISTEEYEALRRTVIARTQPPGGGADAPGLR